MFSGREDLDHADFTVEEMRQMGFGTGPLCLANIYQKFPKLSILDAYCVCLFICYDRENDKMITITPEQEKNRNKLITGILELYLDSSFTTRIGFFCAYSVILVIGLIGE